MEIFSLPWANLRLSWAIPSLDYEKEAWDVVKCPKDGVAIDVGAHQGFYTTKLAKEAGEKGFVVAIEPDSFNFNLLYENILKNNILNIFMHLVALSDYDGMGSLVTYRHDVAADSAKHFLRGTAVGQPYWDKPSTPIPKPEWESNVVVRTLDSLMKQSKPKRIDLIKIDVEGAELKVLEGAKETLKNYGPKLTIEVHYGQEDALNKLLVSLGYDYTVYIPKLSHSGNGMAVFEAQ